MSSYIVIPLTAAVLLIAFGCVILTIGVRQRANRIAGGMHLAAGYWAFCEVLWNVAPDPVAAAALHRLAVPGFVFVGPLVLQLVDAVCERPIPAIQRIMPAYYGYSILLLLAGWTTPLIVERMVPTDFGYGLVPGPLFLPWLLSTALAGGTAAWIFGRAGRKGSVQVARRNGPLLVLLVFSPFVLGILSDAVLPLLGIQVPRLATLCFAFSGGATLWGLNRYGYSMLSFGDFSRRIVRKLPDGLLLTSLTGRVRLTNEAAESLLELGSGEAIGLALADLIDIPLLDPIREVSQLDATLTTPAGAMLPVRLSTSIVPGNDGQALGFVVIVSDQREMKELRNSVITTGRLAAVGQLAAGIAHEINNPLAFVRSNLSLLRRQWEPFAAALERHSIEREVGVFTEDWEELIEESLEGVDRAVTIVADVKDFSHAGVGDRVLADLRELLEQVLRMASPQLGIGIEVVRQFGDVEPLRCQPQRLKQLFLNLVVNAAQAIEGEGRIFVATESRPEEAVVRVEDDGTGIPDELVERIFDPFFTTKAVGEGTGLGLAISHEIARAHGGEIVVRDREGGGACFEVLLPRYDDRAG